MEEQSRSHAVVQAELMLLAFLIGFGALKWLSSGEAVNVEVNIEETSEEEDYIRWVDFDVSYEALSQAYDYDIGT